MPFMEEAEYQDLRIAKLNSSMVLIGRRIDKIKKEVRARCRFQDGDVHIETPRV